MNFNATILGQIISFVLFVFFCMKYIWPLLMAAIEKRQKEIAESLTLAKQAKKDLNLAMVHAEDQIRQAKEKAQVIIECANKQHAQILNEAKIAAKKEHAKIIARAQVEIDTERKRALEELRRHISALVITSTEKIIEHSVNKVINDNIIDKVIDELYKKGS